MPGRPPRLRQLLPSLVARSCATALPDLGRLAHPTVSTTPPVLVSATRADAEAFPQGTLLGRSLQLPVHSGWQPQIRNSNRQPLAEVYNQAIEQADPASLLVFCHDDVWLGEDSLLQPLEQALQRFDLVGVAGNRLILPGHSTWCFTVLSGRLDLTDLVGASPFLRSAMVFRPPAHTPAR